LFVQTKPCPHFGQTSSEPQPSSIVPHLAPSASQVLGVQPHLLGTPLPPQVRGGWHIPQSSVPPHPSDVVPQL